MNIALFSDAYLPDINGVATSVHSLFKLLQKNGHNVYVVCPGDTKETYMKDNVIYLPGLVLKKLYNYKLSGFFDNDAFNILKKLKLDIVHINTEFGVGQFGIIVAEKCHAALVYTYHTMYEDYTYYGFKGYFDRFSKWAIREFTKTCLLKADEIISPSEKTKIYLKSIGIDNYINIVPTGFDFTRFQHIDNKEEVVKKIKAKFNIKEDEKVLLFLGRVAKEKSIEVIIEGYRQYLNTYKDIKTKLVIIGDGPYLNNIKELVDSLKLENDVIFTGRVPQTETQNYYAIGDIYVNASISETQGLTFMEAMASDLLVLCRFDSALLGTINNNVNGFFYIDENDFKDRLHEVLLMSEKDKQFIKDNAFKSIDRFSEQTFYRNIIGVYNRARRKNW